MRPTTWLSVLAVCLLAGVSRAQAPVRAASGQGAGPTAWSEEVSGFGLTHEEAKEDALENARKSVADFLQDTEFGSSWSPSVEDLRRWGMVKEIRHEEKNSPRIDWYHRVDVRVEVNAGNLREIRVRAQRENVMDRQVLSAKLLAALVALLAILACYFRLEELTRGYYTGLLRVFLLLCVGLLGAGLWLVV